MSTSSFPTNHNAAFISLPYKITAHYHQAPSLLAVSNLLYYPLHKHPIQLKYCPHKSLQWPPTWFPLLHYSVAEGIRWGFRQVHLFWDWVKGHGALQPGKRNSTQIKPFTTSHSPAGASESAHFGGTPRTSCPLLAGKSGSRIPPATTPL